MSDKKKITPELVIEAYKTKGLTPMFAGFGLMVDQSGIYCSYMGEVCALGALMEGEIQSNDLDTDIVREVEARYAVDAWAFIDGFDDNTTEPGAGTEDYQLGQTCREAVMKYIKGEP